MRRLVRPDALREPVEERKAVGLVAEEHLAEVHVRLHQPRDDRFARAVDDAGAARGAQRLADAGDAIALHQHVGAQHAAARVHGHDGAAAQEDHASSRINTFAVTRLR